MKERDVSAYLARRVDEIGGEARRVEWINRRNAPDWVIFYGGTHWVETKAPGVRPRSSQEREFERMVKHGAYVHIIDTKEKVDKFIWLISGK